MRASPSLRLCQALTLLACSLAFNPLPLSAQRGGGPGGRGPGGGNPGAPAFVAEAIGGETPAYLTAEWHYVEFPGVQLIANTRESVAEAYATAIRDQSRLLDWVLPSAAGAAPAPPSVFVLDLTPVKPLAGIEQPKGAGGPSSTGWYVTDWDQAITYVPLANHRTAETAANAVLRSVNSHLLLQISHSLKMDLPPWFLVGWRTTGKNITGNKLYVPAAMNRDEDGKQNDTQPLPGLEAVFAWKPAPTIEPAEMQRLIANARLFTAWALYQDNGQRRDSFWRFVRAAHHQPVVTEALFQEHFGASFADVQARLAAEWDKTSRTRGHEIDLGRPANAPRIAARRATETEVAAFLGEWARLAPQELPAMRAPLHQASTYVLERALRTAPDSRLHASAGLLYSEIGNSADAIRNLEAAVAAGNARPRVHYELARLRYAAAAASPAEEGRLSAAQAASIVAPLRAAMPDSSQWVGTYDVLADTLLRTAQKPSREQLAPLMEAARLFPRNLRFIGKIAVLHRQYGYTEDAALLADQGLRFADTDVLRAAFTQLKASLQPAP